MRLFIVSWLPMLNRLLLILYGSYRLIICIGISINLIWNGTPVFCRFDTIQGEPPNIVIFSVVKFLISMNDIPVQQPNTNKSLANSKSGLFNSIVVKACNSSSVRKPRSLWSGSTLYWANGLRAILHYSEQWLQCASMEWSISTLMIEPIRPHFSDTSNNHE